MLGRWEQALPLSRNPGSSPHQSLFTAVIHLSHPSRLRCLALVRAHFLSGEPDGHSVIGTMNQKSPSSGIQKARARQRGWVRRDSFGSFARLVAHRGWLGFGRDGLWLLPCFGCVRGGRDEQCWANFQSAGTAKPRRAVARALPTSHANRRAVRNARACYLAEPDGGIASAQRRRMQLERPTSSWSVSRLGTCT